MLLFIKGQSQVDWLPGSDAILHVSRMRENKGFFSFALDSAREVRCLNLALEPVFHIAIF